MSSPAANGTAVNRPLSDASVDRLACLRRHWTWAEEAMARFDQELAAGWGTTTIRSRIHLAVAPLWDGLRADPRFNECLARMKLRPVGTVSVPMPESH